jgi:hypothetical protein
MENTNNSNNPKKPRRKIGEKWGLPFTKEELKERYKLIQHKKKYIDAILTVLCREIKKDPHTLFSAKGIKDLVDEFYAKTGRSNIKIPLSTLYRNLYWLWENFYIISNKGVFNTKVGDITQLAFKAEIYYCPIESPPQKPVKRY